MVVRIRAGPCLFRQTSELPGSAARNARHDFHGQGDVARERHAPDRRVRAGIAQSSADPARWVSPPDYGEEHHRGVNVGAVGEGIVWKTEWSAVIGKKLFVEARAGQFVASRAERPNGASPRTEDLQRAGLRRES